MEMDKVSMDTTKGILTAAIHRADATVISFLDNPAILANPAIRKRFFQTVRLLVLLLGWLAIWYLGKEYGMSSMTQYFFFIGWMYTCLDPGFDHTKRFGAATYQFAQAGFQGLSGANTQSDS